MSSQNRPDNHAHQILSSPLRVLIADGNADAVDSLSLLLVLWGHEVHVARSGPEALEAAHALLPDVLLAEIVLPALNGLDLAVRLRAVVPAPSPVLIALTGLGEPASRQRVRQAGYRHHLLKPVAPETLQALLDAISRCRPDPEPVTILFERSGDGIAPRASRCGLAAVE